MSTKIIIVQGEMDTSGFKNSLESQGFSVDTVKNAQEIKGPAQGGSVYSVSLIFSQGGTDLYQAVRDVRSKSRGIRCIPMIQNGTQEQTVQALKAGAADYFDYTAQPHDVVQSVKKLNDEFNARFKNVGGQVVPINAAPKLTVIQGQGGTSTVSELPKVTQGPGEGYMDMKKKWIDAFEREYLTGILERHQGNVSASAREAKLDRSNFLRLLRRHGLKAQVFRTEEQNVSAAKAA